jgi:hypothetical protein
MAPKHHVKAAAHGWSADLPDEEVLRRLLALNRARGAN